MNGIIVEQKKPNFMVGCMRFALVLLSLCLVSKLAVASPLAYLVSAIESSPEQRSAEEGIKIAEEAIVVAKARGLPFVQGSASYLVSKPQSGGGSSGGSERLNAQVVLNQQIFNLSTSAGIAVAEFQLEVAKERARQTRQQILLSTYRAYLATALAAENLLLIDKRRETLLEQLNVAESLFLVGKANRLQVLNVQAQIASLNAEQVSAENSLVIAGDTLESVSGKPPDDISQLTLAPEPPGRDVHYWKSEVVHAPAARAAAYEVDAQQQSTRQLLSLVLPSLTAQGTVDKELATQFSLQLSVPIFSSGGATAEKNRSERQEEVLKAAYDSIIKQGELAASSAYRDFIQNQARHEALATSVEVGRERLEVALASIELSAGILADALDAESDLAAAELQIAEARHGQLEAYLTLLAETGRLGLEMASELEGLFS